MEILNSLSLVKSGFVSSKDDEVCDFLFDFFTLNPLTLEGELKTNIFFEKQLKEEKISKIITKSNFGCLKNALDKYNFFTVCLSANFVNNHLKRKYNELLNEKLLEINKLNFLIQKLDFQEDFKSKFSKFIFNIEYLLSNLSSRTIFTLKSDLKWFQKDADFKLTGNDEKDNLINSYFKCAKSLIDCIANINKAKYFDETYLTIGRNGNYCLMFVKNVSVSCKSKKIGKYDKSFFQKQVLIDSRQICGTFDSLSTILSDLNLNDLFKTTIFDENSLSKEKTDIIRNCFVKFKIEDSLFKANNAGSIQASSIVRNIRVYFNLYCAYICYYRSYGINILYEDIIKTLSEQPFAHISLLNKNDKDKTSIVQNHSKNECINYFSCDTTFVYGVSQMFVVPNAKHYTDYELESIFNNHEFRYLAKENNETILSSIIYYGLCLRAHIRLQEKVSMLSRINRKYRRMFFIHNLQKDFSICESIYRTDSIYSKQERSELCVIVANNLLVSKYEKISDHLTEHIWQEANTTNSKLSMISSVFQTTVSIIGALVCAAVGLIFCYRCFFNSKDNITNIVVVVLAIIGIIAIVLLNKIKRK